MLPEVTDFCRLLLLHHPELEAGSAAVALGAGNAALSRRGKRAVLRWMDLLQAVPIDAVHASDQEQSAAPAAGLARAKQLEVQLEPRLRDQAMGRWQGQRWDALVESDPTAVTDFFESFAERVPPDGESLGQATERMLQWWWEQAPESAGRTLAVITSGAMIAGFAAAMLGMRLTRCLSLRLPPGGLGILDVYGNGVRIAAWHPDVFHDGTDAPAAT